MTNRGRKIMVKWKKQTIRNMVDKQLKGSRSPEKKFSMVLGGQPRFKQVETKKLTIKRES